MLVKVEIELLGNTIYITRWYVDQRWRLNTFKRCHAFAGDRDKRMMALELPGFARSTGSYGPNEYWIHFVKSVEEVAQ